MLHDPGDLADDRALEQIAARKRLYLDHLGANVGQSHGRLEQTVALLGDERDDLANAGVADHGSALSVYDVRASTAQLKAFFSNGARDFTIVLV